MSIIKDFKFRTFKHFNPKQILLFTFLFLFFAVLLFFPYTKQTVISGQDKIQGSENFSVEKAFSSPLLFITNQVTVTPDDPGVITIDFKEPFSFTGFSMYFPGDHIQPSYAPKDLAVYYFDSFYQKQILDTIHDNTKPYYEFHANKPIEATKIEIAVSSVLYPDNNNTGSVLYTDLRFYTTQKTNLFGFIKNTLSQSKMTWPFYWLLYLISSILLFVPGFVVIDFFARRKKHVLHSDTLLIFGPIFAILAISLMVVLYVLSSLSVFLYLYPIFCLVAFTIFIHKKHYLKLKHSKQLLVFIFLNIFLVFLVMARRDYLFNLPYIEQYLSQFNSSYVPAGSYLGYFDDNMFPWRISRLILHRYPLQSPMAQQLLANTSLFERTPILPLISTQMLILFGENHFIYQRFFEVLTILPFISFFVLFKRMYGKKLSSIVQVMMLIHIQLRYLAFNSEHAYKYFSIYPIILALFVFFSSNSKYKHLSVALLVSLSFLIHPSTLIYVLVIGCLYLWKYKFSFCFVKNIMPAVIFSVILLTSWLYIPRYLYSLFNLPQQSSRYINDLQLTGDNFLVSKLKGLSVLLIPSTQSISSPDDSYALTSIDYVHRFFDYSFLANLTPVFAVLLAIKMFQVKKEDMPLLLLGFLPLIFHWLIYVHRYDTLFNQGGGYFFYYSFCLPFLFVFGVKQIIPFSIWVKRVLVGSYILSMILTACYLADAMQVLSRYISFQVIDTLSGLTKLFFVALAIFLVYLVENKKQINSTK